jgi:hypothetical protein
MKTRKRFLGRTSGRVTGAAVGICAAVTVFGAFVLMGGSSQAVSAIGLGTAESFAVLAGSGITNTGPTTITGDIGSHPTDTITGSESITLVDGTNHAGDAVTQGAKNDLVTAYLNAESQATTSTISADLGGMTLVSGVYTSASTLALTGTLTLDAAGDPNAVFVFQAGSTLTTASGSQVALINGAQACNVFWQVGSSATLGTGSTFRGTILALTSITATTSVVVDGRLLARNGAVTLDTNTVTRSICAAVTPTPTPSETTATPTPTPTETTATPTPTPTETTATPTPTPTETTATPTPTPTETTVAPTPAPTSTPAPSSPQQVPAKPSGGVAAGDENWGKGR